MKVLRLTAIFLIALSPAAAGVGTDHSLLIASDWVTGSVVPFGLLVPVLGLFLLFRLGARVLGMRRGRAEESDRCASDPFDEWALGHSFMSHQEDRSSRFI